MTAPERALPGFREGRFGQAKLSETVERPCRNCAILVKCPLRERCKLLQGLPLRSGRGAVWLARLNGVQEVGGSNPLAPTSQGQSGQQLPAGLFSHLEGSSRGRAELRAEFRKSAGLTARAFRGSPGDLSVWLTG